MWTIFEVLVLITVGGIIILGGEIDSRAIGVSAFLGLAALVVWLASSFIFSKLIELTWRMYRRRREFSGLVLFTRQYFRGHLWPVAKNVGALVSRTIFDVAVHRRMVLLLTCLLVTGCATYQANIDDANCQAAGAKFGSRDYAQCRDKLQAAHQR
jgi:hypothetical protein